MRHEFRSTLLFAVFGLATLLRLILGDDGDLPYIDLMEGLDSSGNDFVAACVWNMTAGSGTDILYNTEYLGAYLKDGKKSLGDAWDSDNPEKCQEAEAVVGLHTDERVKFRHVHEGKYTEWSAIWKVKESEVEKADTIVCVLIVKEKNRFNVKVVGEKGTLMEKGFARYPDQEASRYFVLEVFKHPGWKHHYLLRAQRDGTDWYSEGAAMDSEANRDKMAELIQKPRSE
ncbi:unnamed protein product, partial [Mesorhabditis spiculigera]